MNEWNTHFKAYVHNDENTFEIRGHVKDMIRNFWVKVANLYQANIPFHHYCTILSLGFDLLVKMSNRKSVNIQSHNKDVKFKTVFLLNYINKEEWRPELKIQI